MINNTSLYMSRSLQINLITRGLVLAIDETGFEYCTFVGQNNVEVHTR